jgi:hypothetical protein
MKACAIQIGRHTYTSSFVHEGRFVPAGLGCTSSRRVDHINVVTPRIRVNRRGASGRSAPAENDESG